LTDHIYELRPDLDYVGLTFVDARNFIFPYERRFDTLCRMAVPLEVELNDESAHADSDPVPDFPHFSVGECCFSSGAWAVIKDNLKISGKTVRLAHNDGKRILEFVLLEPASDFDCLDLGRSDLRYFSVPPYNIMCAESIVLRNIEGINVDIFKVPHLRSAVFCTERFKQVVVTNLLTGFEFHDVSITA